ncbi:hypothetical protein GQ53DRAFT_751577 [Thozetella sp. PMI_491]|nr:hypothetical protein GQ53DRAFT_751577 [Thozetella sp. PMI_491]
MPPRLLVTVWSSLLSSACLASQPPSPRSPRKALGRPIVLHGRCSFIQQRLTVAFGQEVCCEWEPPYLEQVVSSFALMRLAVRPSPTSSVSLSPSHLPSLSADSRLLLCIRQANEP